MAEPKATAAEDQQLKQRAMRRLAIALGLIGLAIVALAVLDRYSAAPPAAPDAAPAVEPPEISDLPPPQPIDPARPDAGPPDTDSADPGVPAAPRAVPAPPPPEVEDDDLSVPQTKLVPAVPPRPAAPEAPAGPTAEDMTASRTERVVDTVASYVVQLGVFTGLENAQAVHARLREQGIPAFLETRVVVGPFRDRAEADAARRRIAALGVAGVVALRK